MFGLGSVAGPISISFLMAALGPVGYYWGLGPYFVPLGIYAFARIVSHVKPGQRRFVSLPPRSSTAAVMLADADDDG